MLAPEEQQQVDWCNPYEQMECQYPCVFNADEQICELDAQIECVDKRAAIPNTRMDVIQFSTFFTVDVHVQIQGTFLDSKNQ